MKFTVPRYFRRENTPEIFVAVFAFFASTFMAWYVYAQHLTTTLADQAAHLVFARLLTDSMTPGITQLGTWPPLLHILMMPATAIDPLFRSGLAGAVTLIPIFIVGVVLLYRLTYELTKNTMLSVVAALIYILNPYVLYYAVTPMMEVLFITMVIAVVYFMVLWMEYGHFRHLLLAGIFITLASISRYEGIFLIPVAVMIVIVRLILNRRRLDEIEATVIVFGIPSVLGLGYLMVYDLVFAGHPLAFVGFGSGISWFIGDDSVPSLTKNSSLMSLQYSLHASYYMFGKTFVFLSFACAFFSVIFLKDRFKIISALSLLLVPFLAILLALYRGSNSIHVPELPPFDHFHNDRYMITWIGFLVLSLILAGSLFSKIRMRIITFLFLLAMLFLSGNHLYEVAFAENFLNVRENVSSSNREVTSSFIKTLQENYDFGKIFAVRFNNDFHYIDSNFPLRVFIYEGNYKYFDQTLNRPWLYARWVVMQRPDSVFSGSFRDPIKEKWLNKMEFDHYYTVVAEEKDRRLYKLNEDAVIRYANDNGLDIGKIPSLNPSMEIWNPETIEEDIRSRR